MATLNPFDLLGDDDAEDPSLIIAAQQQKIVPKKTVAPSAKQPSQTKAAAQPKLSSKPIPPAQSAREAKFEPARGGHGGGRGYSRGHGAAGGSNRNSASNENSYGGKEISAGLGAPDEVDGKHSERSGGYGAARGPPCGGRRGGFSNGEAGEGELDHPRRTFDRRNGTGRVTEGVVIEDEANLNVEKPVEGDYAADAGKDITKDEAEEKEHEDKEMTLEEYEKLLEDKRKARLALKTEERKVDVKEFESMQPLSNKKASNDIFIKLRSEKDKKKELAEKEERAKKSVSINEFLKPTEGERLYGGRGRGRGRGARGGYTGGSEMSNVQAPAIEDPRQFPTLGGK